MKHLFNIINPNFKKYAIRFLIQTAFIVLFMFCVLVSLMYGLTGLQMDLLTAIGATSLAASGFIVFALPGSPVAVPRRILGGYIIAIICGVGGRYSLPIWMAIFPVPHLYVHCFAGAFAAGTAMLLMASLSFEHPPSMGLSLGLVMDHWDNRVLIVVVVSAIILCVIKKKLNGWLVNLL